MEPLREIPQNLYDAFTINKKVKVEYVYQDDRPHDGHPQRYKREMVEFYLQRIKQKKALYYGKTDVWLYRALERYGINRKQIAVFGSRTPFYESVCLFYGARPTTIEYNRIVSEDPRLTMMTVEEYKRNPIVFDAAFSISSFEHDGLGRYGDPINPDGDLQAMAWIKSIIKKGGTLFLSVPVGRDKLIWNLHRIYGRLRLPKLLQGWKILSVYGRRGQPVFVLENSDAGKSNLNFFINTIEIIDLARQGYRKIFS